MASTRKAGQSKALPLIINRLCKLPPLKASQPTVTVGSYYSDTSIVFYQFIPFSDPRIWVANKASWPVSFNYNGNNYMKVPDSNTDSGNWSAFGFRHDGQVFAFEGRAGDTYVIIADGELINPITVASAGGYSTAPITVDFGSRARRSLIVLVQTFGLAGIKIGPRDTIEPLDLSAFQSIVCFTDSYGSGGSLAGAGLFGEIALRLGWYRYSISPGGGSGWQTGGTAGVTFDGRVDTMIIGNPDFVLLAGGLNDSGIGLQAAVASTLAHVRMKAPTAILIVVGAWTPNNGARSTAAAKNASIAAAMAGIAGPWIWLDSYAGTWLTSSGASGVIGGGPWQTGNGQVGTPLSGNFTFTGALSGATSATLTTAFIGPTGTYTVQFSDGTQKNVTLTNGSTAVSWSGAVTATASAAFRSTSTSDVGNADVYNADGAHFNAAGNSYLAGVIASGVAEALLNF